VRCETLALGEQDAGIVRARDGRSDLVVYLFHGLGGSSASGYVRRCAREVLAGGHAVVVFDHRGCGLGRGLARRPHHAGAIEDILRVIAHGRTRWPGRRHLAIGFSLSGNDLLLGLGRQALRGPDLAIAVNPPIDLADAAERISRGRGRLYDLRFARRVLAGARERVRAGLLEQVPKVSLAAGLLEVDEAYTARAAGFANRAEYYRLCSSRQLLKEVRIPTLLLSAADDPIVDARGLAAAPRSRFVQVHIERWGGHMGYLTRSGLGLRPWLPGTLAHYVEALRRVRVLTRSPSPAHEPPSARAAPP
jgi:predicted alpha/beta-fold hydrolase